MDFSSMSIESVMLVTNDSLIAALLARSTFLRETQEDFHTFLEVFRPFAASIFPHHGSRDAAANVGAAA